MFLVAVIRDHPGLESRDIVRIPSGPVSVDFPCLQRLCSRLVFIASPESASTLTTSR